MKCPKKHVKKVFCHVMAIAFIFEMPQNRRISISVIFLFEYLVTCFSLEMPHFELLENLEMPQFSRFQNQMGNMGHFEDFVVHFEEKARD